MTKEDASQKKEKFFCHSLDKSDIDTLLEPKVFTNQKIIGIKGEKNFKPETKIFDTNGTLKQNLLIKGNNLLALHSLKQKLGGKVKMIYIDPPYNTGGDANIFTYNNNFNHSTWLTFMKNRLEVAKDLLKEDGFIAIAIDHAELFYLGVLADEIFGRKNFLGNVTIVHKPDGRQFAKFFGASTEYMLIYAKNINIAQFNKVIIEESMLKSFNLEDEKGKYKEENFIMLSNGSKNLRVNKPKGWYPIYVSQDLEKITLDKIKGYREVFPQIKSGEERTWKTYKEKFLERLSLGVYIAKRDSNGRIGIYEKYRMDKGQTYKTHWVDKKYNATTYGTRLLKKIIGRDSVSYPKSLYTVLDALKMMTQKDDIILDFFAGSGTTGHAVMELNKEDGGNRKFILVEQINEHFKICKERITKVIQENTNLFNDMSTEGAVVFELKKFNQEFIEKINSAKSETALDKIYKDMQKNAFFVFWFDKIEFEKEYKNLTLNEKKEKLTESLDQNQLYLNYKDMNDRNSSATKEEKDFTNNFYDK